MEKCYNNIYQGKTVFLTGHTGFKGAWLAFWLKLLGAHIIGYSLTPTKEYNIFSILNLEEKIDKSFIADIRDRETLTKALVASQADIVFHLAAQPLVRLSYYEPLMTYETNVIGTLNVLEAARKTHTVKAFVCITTDKCYENKEIDYAYKEDDPFGGYDMYSSSKACVEILANSYRNSFLLHNNYFALATARAGNVIGGGDWAKDRLIPDCIKAIVSKEKIYIRNPKATRPWQYVLEPLAGYLRLGQLLLEKGAEYAQGFNFGPERDKDVKVCEVAQKVVDFWGNGEVVVDLDEHVYEANLLQLDVSKAKEVLGVYPVYTVYEAIRSTVAWYKAFYEKKTDMVAFTEKQIIDFLEKREENRIYYQYNME